MFELSLPEFVLCAIIGLLVLGPQRLPKVAAEIGKWVGRARRTATQLRRQLEREIELADLEPPPPPRTPAQPNTPSASPPPADTMATPAEPEPTIAPPAKPAEPAEPGETAESSESSDSGEPPARHTAAGSSARERLETTDTQT
jgi:sec-independent protein translocase protein TatB